MKKVYKKILFLLVMMVALSTGCKKTSPKNRKPATRFSQGSSIS